MKNLRHSVFALTCCTLLLTLTSVAAQTPGDIAQRKEQKRTELTGAPHMEVISSLVEIKPGEELALHWHHGVEAAYVIQGASIQIPGKPVLQLATGTTQLNLRDIKHGGFKVVGDTSLKLFTVHVVDKGQPLYEGANK
jgi:quercetin dioxygenase-like cupin family protein